MSWRGLVIVMSAAIATAGCGPSRVQEETQRQQLQQLAEYQRTQAIEREERAEKVAYSKTHQMATTPPMREAFEAAVRKSLKDPYSAQFQHGFAFLDKTGALNECGRVNAKNSFGGYVGFSPYKAVAVASDPLKLIVPAGALLAEGNDDLESFYEAAPECRP